MSNRIHCTEAVSGTGFRFLVAVFASFCPRPRTAPRPCFSKRYQALSRCISRLQNSVYSLSILHHRQTLILYHRTMFSLTNILLLGSGLLSLTSAVHLPAYAALERNLDIRQAVTTPTSSLATNGGSPTTSATSADSSSIANDTNSVPSACEQICLSTYNLLE